MIILCCREHTG